MSQLDVPCAHSMLLLMLFLLLPQVGVVLLSILCHIWKIVPDLYEAIVKLRGKQSPDNGDCEVSMKPQLRTY